MSHPESTLASTQGALPIELSVHGMPKAAALDVKRTRMGRLKMLIVWAVCAAPVLASYFTYYVIRPQGRTNYGDLITPSRSMPPGLALQTLDGRVVSPSALKGQWLLVVVSSGQCDALCQKQLYLQRQLREVLGKDKDRLDRVWLITDQAPVPAAIQPALAQAWTLRVSGAAWSSWLSAQAGHQLTEHLYLVDPKGDWMMRFPAEADPSRVKKDLLRLMKSNESWDEPGR